MKTISVIVILLLRLSILSAQINPPDVGEVFRDDVIPRIDITINENYYNDLIKNTFSDVEYPVTFKFDNTFINGEVDSAGFGLKGSFSRYFDKKSFRISLNTFKKGQKFYGLEKINLVSDARDPMMLRPRLAWYMAQNVGNIYLNTNYVKLYINDVFKGVYINTEQIDEVYLNKWFGTNSGNLYKCHTIASLEYISDNQNDYKIENGGIGGIVRTYELKTNRIADDYSDLARFIKILNKPDASDFKDSVCKYFNVQAYLKVLAFEKFVGHWDSYVNWGNNYLLYNDPQQDQFNYLSSDADLTFGLMYNPRIWRWNLYSPDSTLGYRPLITNLLAVQEFKDIYSFYLRQLIEKYPIDSIQNIIKILQAEIRPCIFEDPFYLKSFKETDFDKNLDQPVGEDGFGLLKFMISNIDSINAQIEDSNTAPIISMFKTNDIYSNESLSISCMIENEDENLEVALQYRFGDEEFKTASFDIRNHNSIPFAGNCEVMLDPFYKKGILKIKIVATDETGKTSFFPLNGEYPVNILKSTYNGFEIFPNPVIETLTIKTGILPDEVFIFNTTGRMVMNIIMNTGSGNQIDVSDLPVGIYIIKAIQGEMVYSVKMIKILK